ncbi:amino acid adenylation domain-containing protein [Paenibacillus sp. FSL H8-0122]|uniref:amino acid adenylation domain-containing protein n=1 Tax=Paenibacillus sp. FSL H8-0122 TaxID=2954510 RepID=UPI0030FB0F66
MYNDRYDLDTGTLIPYIQMFQESLQKNRTKTALLYGEDEITYEELDLRSSRVAAYLSHNAVTSRSIVGLFMKRTLDLPITLLGIMKTGASFLPLDPDYPQQRIRHIIEDSGCQLIIVNQALKTSLDYYGHTVVAYEEIHQYEEIGYQLPTVSMVAAAYLLYTSGSTGLPKGTVINQQALASFVYGVTKEIQFSQAQTMLFLTTISFDISLLELLIPLLYGMKIVIADERGQRNPYLLKKIITEKDIDMLQMTPSAMQLLINYDKELDCLRRVSHVLLGGEALPSPVLEHIRNYTDVNIYNLYGPTETTIWCMVSDLTNQDTVTIGIPFHSVKVYVLDSAMNEVEPGGVGELYIGGPQVAGGYWNSPEHTTEKFKNYSNIEAGIIFKTGDLVRLSEVGKFEFMGRNDHLVKIRGFRIEPGEVEAVLLRQEGITHATVVPRMGKNGNLYLSGYYVSDEWVDKQTLVDSLRNVLPSYMIPEQLTQLEQLPYTPNFKVDRKYLASLDFNACRYNKVISDQGV